MSKHRRTKSSGNYFQINHEFLVKDDDFEYNETKFIIQKIQQMATQTQQIVEKLDVNTQGMYNNLFNFGKQHSKEKADLNLSQISECSSTHSAEYPSLKLRNQTIQSPIRMNTQNSQSLQQTIQYLEQEIEQMKMKQDELHTVNMFLLQETQKNRQELLRSQKKNEERIKQLIQKIDKEQSNTNGTSDGLD
ncbi:unnamed protein product [Paramecium primaurelia]|uniref:Uncharacterized protein n=1 Tax=Paramecium primaurelia TaxID=5886 RepID=A0A8S1NWN1_PARPR|nr:unnamed protein product [Paramecium primaurelia]